MEKNYLFLGFAIPNSEMDEVFKIDNLPAIQTHKFNWSLIKGLLASEDLKFTFISSRPVSDYPLYSKKIIKHKIWNIEIMGKNIKIVEIPFINSSLLKLVTRFFSGLYFSIKEYSKIKNKGGVIVYSVHVPYMLIGYIISKIYNIDYISIWTDPPSIRHGSEGKLKSKLRRLELSISKFLMKKTKKVIALTRYLAIDFAPKKPYLVIEGIVDELDINFDRNTIYTPPKNITKFVYTGSLSKRYGIKNIVEAFTMFKVENVELDIYGRGDFEEELKEISSKNKMIKYNGFVSNKLALKAQQGADFLINARSANEDYVKYSFPSKTLEYMLSGTPLITTFLPGIPEEYKDYLIILENNEPSYIYSRLKSMLDLDIDSRILLGTKAQEFAKSKNYLEQGRKIINFIVKA